MIGKTASHRLKEISKMVYDAGIDKAARISMQTTDPQVLENIERANIKLSEYKKFIAYFHQDGIPINSDMILGLPGQTREACK